MATVWLVDWDEAAVRGALEGAGHAVEAQPLARLVDGQGQGPDVAFVHVRTEPPAVLARRLHLQARATAAVLVLPPSAAAKAPDCLDAGAADVWLEPVAPDAAPVIVARLVRDLRLRARLGHLEEATSRGSQLDEVIGESAAMKELLEQISRISRRSALGPPPSVLLTGETGTGKGLVARAMHYGSRRRDGPFVEINCAAIPATLLEGELFGHEKGAFTDARSARVGLVEAAHGGTLFLDEVTYLPPEGQAKLLTVLESRKVRRVGGTTERAVDVQVVAASSHDVAKLVSDGAFRPELFHRLNSLWFKLPALRDRGDDAVLLASRFVARICADYRLAAKQLAPSALAAIRAHHWPGNVRELFHAVERAVLSEERDAIEAGDLALQPASAQARVEAAAGGAVKVSLPPGGAPFDEIEKALIEDALRATRGNVTRAAAYLRLTRDTLRSRMEKHSLDAARFTG